MDAATMRRVTRGDAATMREDTKGDAATVRKEIRQWVVKKIRRINRNSPENVFLVRGSCHGMHRKWKRCTQILKLNKRSLVPRIHAHW